MKQIVWRLSVRVRWEMLLLMVRFVRSAVDYSVQYWPTSYILYIIVATTAYPSYFCLGSEVIGTLALGRKLEVLLAPYIWYFTIGISHFKRGLISPIPQTNTAPVVTYIGLRISDAMLWCDGCRDATRELPNWSRNTLSSCWLWQRSSSSSR